MPYLKSKDLVALLVVSIFGVLKLKGSDGELTPIVMLIIGYYFAHRRNGDDKGV